METPPASKLTIRNYSKASQKRTCECLRDLLAALTSDSARESLEWLGGPSQAEQTIFIIVDGVNGRELEDALYSHGTKFHAALKNTKSCARLTTKSTRKEKFHLGVWNSIFNLPDPELTTPTNFEPLTSFNDSKPPSLYESFEKFLLSEDCLLNNGFPLASTNPEFESTTDWKLSGKRVDKIFAMDCEMVETENGSELARISIVDHNYKPVYNHLVLPLAPVTNYLEEITGLSPQTFTQFPCKTLSEVLGDLRKLIDSETILVGHSLENDLIALGLIHEKVVDTSVLFLTDSGGKQGLKSLAYHHLKLKIQNGTHDSIEDAKVALALAHMKVQVLTQFDNYAVSTTNFSLLTGLPRRGRPIIFDFDFPIFVLKNIGDKCEKKMDSRDVVVSIKAQAQLSPLSPDHSKFVFGRILVPETSISIMLKKFADSLAEIMKESGEKKVDIVVATVSHMKNNQKPPFGYDLLLFL